MSGTFFTTSLGLMYPVSLGFTEAEKRITALIANGHHAEALVTSVFTIEKTVRRTLRFCAVSRGFTSKHAEALFSKMGFKDLQDVWPCFSANGSTLPNYIGQAHWQHVPVAVTMRNKLAHGERAYKLADCKDRAEQVLSASRVLQAKLQADIAFDGWSRLPTRRKPALQWLAK